MSDQSPKELDRIDWDEGIDVPGEVEAIYIVTKDGGVISPTDEVGDLIMQITQEDDRTRARWSL